MMTPKKFVDDTRVPNHPYQELREVLHIFVTDVQAELAENLVGIYLVGSLALGDFDLDSDVDFLVVLNTELAAENASHLQAVQRKVYAIDCYPARHLEGSYISVGTLNDWDGVGEKKLYYFDNGSTTFEQSVHDNNWHVRWILREGGITLTGQEANTLIPPVPMAALLSEMKIALVHTMQAFAMSINHPLNFWNSQFGQSFAVLTHCRMMHTLHTGAIHSKKAGVEWARNSVDPQWIKLITQAWHDREGVRFGVKIGQRADAKLLDETLEFMQYVMTGTAHLMDPPTFRMDAVGDIKRGAVTLPTVACE